MLRLSRTQLLVLLVLCAVVLAHGTLWPYDFTGNPEVLAVKWRRIFWVPFLSKRPAFKDYVLNVVVFAPLGALVCLYLARGAWQRATTLAPTLAGLAFSASIEVLQFFLPTRYSSMTDITLNTTGAFLGAWATRQLWQRYDTVGPDRVRRFLRAHALGLTLAGYALTVVVASVYSLDPLRSLAAIEARAHAFLASPWIQGATPVKAVGPVLLYGVLTFLAAEWLMQSWPRWRRGRTYLPVFLAGALLAVALEAVLLLFRSRVALRSDLLFGVVGAGYGVILHRLTALPTFVAGASEPTTTVLDARLPSLRRLFVLHYPLMILYAFLYPFDFAADAFHVERQALMPFYYHVANAKLASLSVLVRAIVAWIPFGVVFAHARRQTGRSPGYLAGTLVAVGCQLLIETGRAFSATLWPDITNVLLVPLGVIVGIYAYRHVLAGPPPEPAARPAAR